MKDRHVPSGAGERIRRIRNEYSLTQKQFARLLGISPSYLGSIERGERPLSRALLDRLRDISGLSRDFLTEGAACPSPAPVVREPSAYRLRRDLFLLLQSCTEEDARECERLIHAYFAAKYPVR